MTRSVLVPSSLVREAEDKRAATRKLGTVARAAAVFRVDRLVVYPDPVGERDASWGDGGFVHTVLAYAATAPYLRKEAWGRRSELEYAGVLPPLHLGAQTGSGSNGSGSSRQGIVTEVGPEERVRVNCGLQHPISLPVPPGMAAPREGERVTVRVSSREPVRAKLVDEPQPGFDVERADLATTLTRADAGVRIAASRFGERLTVARLDSLRGECQSAGGWTVAFGAPERGLPAILDIEDAAREGTPSETGTVAVAGHTDTDDDGAPAGEAGGATDNEPRDPRFDLWLNTVPDQGSETVRTEEAMFATLSSLRLPRQ
jgi:predicted SPOUT superfamily RNA methylase MTH1